LPGAISKVTLPEKSAAASSIYPTIHLECAAGHFPSSR